VWFEIVFLAIMIASKITWVSTKNNILVSDKSLERRLMLFLIVEKLILSVDLDASVYILAKYEKFSWIIS